MGVIEAANKVYAKNIRVSKGRGLVALETYRKMMTQFQKHLALARKAIAEGKGHQSEGPGATKMKVGSFTLVNTGGFSSEVMDKVAEVMQKAEAAARTSGLGAVCYGTVQVTNTVGRSAKVLAFYHLDSDELFVRANVDARIDTLQTILHELGPQPLGSRKAGNRTRPASQSDDGSRETKTKLGRFGRYSLRSEARPFGYGLGRGSGDDRRRGARGRKDIEYADLAPVRR